MFVFLSTAHPDSGDSSQPLHTPKHHQSGDLLESHSRGYSQSDEVLHESHSGYVSQSDDALDRGTSGRAGSHDSDRLGTNLEYIDSGTASQSDDGFLGAAPSTGMACLESDEAGFISAETLSDTEAISEETAESGDTASSQVRNDADTPT